MSTTIKLKQLHWPLCLHLEPGAVFNQEGLGRIIKDRIYLNRALNVQQSVTSQGWSSG